MVMLFVKERVTITRAGNTTVTKQSAQTYTEIIFKVCANITEVTKPQIINTKDTDIVTAVSDLLE